MEGARLRTWLECRLADLPGGLGTPLAVERERSKYSSSYECEVLTVRLATGRTLKIFVKDFGASCFPKNEPVQRREREIAVYRQVLAGAGLQAAECYGTIQEEAEGHCWLLLEFVEGVQVRYCEVEQWYPAAAWLGRLEGWSARNRQRLGACSFLVRHDDRFFREKAEGAMREVREISLPLAARLAGLLAGYDEVAELLAAQPQTLVHGSYRAANILIDTRPVPPRVCPVDWEMAACGSALYDLAFLVDGFRPPALYTLVDAYREEAIRQGLAPPDRETALAIVNGFRFFMRLHLLSRARERGLAAERVAQVIDLLQEIRQGLPSRCGDG